MMNSHWIEPATGIEWCQALVRMREAARIGLFVVMLILWPRPAHASPPAPANHDAFVRVTQPNNNYDRQDLAVAASTDNCTATDTTFIQWDMAVLSGGQAIQTATLTLVTRYATLAGQATITLYEAGDNWTEETLTHNNQPAIGAEIESLPAPTAAGQSVTFQSEALVGYLNAQQQLGDTNASFALRLTSGCSPGLTAVVFEDAESPTGQPILAVTTGSCPMDLDINDDGRVDIVDIQLVAAAFGQSGGSADVDCSGLVDLWDIVAVSNAWQ